MNDSWKILRPIQIGDKICKNRVIIAAHSYGYVDHRGLPTAKLIDYVNERAKGGVGMIVIGGTSVGARESALDGNAISADDQIIPRYRKIADLVHSHGVLLLDQLMHSGAYLDPNEGTEVVAPSPIPQEMTCGIPTQLSIKAIKVLIEDFTKAAERCQKGGLDGIELKCDQGLLLHQFLSPYYNRRDDLYGGSYAGRFRLVHEILISIRKRIRNEFIVGVRISGDSMTPGDLDETEGIQIAKDLAKTGLIDFLHVNGATNATYRGYFLNHGDSSLPTANFSNISRKIKRVVDVPVILASLISTPHDAEHIIDSGAADLVAMTRAHIAEPAIIRKIEEGRLNEVRPCVLANQGCVGNHWKGKGVRCVHNPAAGRERELGIGTIKKAKRKKRLLVIGGGVAGLEFSHVAAMRGHSIDLFEKQKYFGGQLTIGGKLPYRQGLIGIVDFLVEQNQRLKVNLHAGVEVNLQEIMLASADYDAIVLATGSNMYIPPIFDVPKERAHTINDLFDPTLNFRGKNVLVVDIDWRQNALSVAEWLVQKDCKVTIASPMYMVCENIDAVTRTSYYSRIFNNANFMPLTSLVSLNDDRALVRNVLNNETRFLSPIDEVVFVTGSQPSNSLYDELVTKIDNVERIGDCVHARGIPEAMLDANRLARKI